MISGMKGHYSPCNGGQGDYYLKRPMFVRPCNIMQVSLYYSSLINDNGAPIPSVEGEVIVSGTGSGHGAVMSAGSIALVSISGVAVLLICLCMTEISKSLTWSRRHRNAQALRDQSMAAPAQAVAGSNPGLARWVIKRIPVAKYKKQQHRIPNHEINLEVAVISAANSVTESVECAVCLSSFEEDEPVRILPHCAHAFHLPCIDRWFESHCTCPICRMEITQLDIAKTLILQLPAEATQQSMNDISINGFGSNVYELHHAEVHHQIDHHLAPALNLMIDPDYNSGAEGSRQYIITTQASTGTASTNNNLFSSTDNSSNNVHSVATRWPWQPQYSAVFSSLRRSLSTGLTHGGAHYSQVWKATRPSLHMSARFHIWNSEDLLHPQPHESQV